MRAVSKPSAATTTVLKLSKRRGERSERGADAGRKSRRGGLEELPSELRSVEQAQKSLQGSATEVAQQYATEREETKSTGIVQNGRIVEVEESRNSDRLQTESAHLFAELSVAQPIEIIDLIENQDDERERSKSQGHTQSNNIGKHIDVEIETTPEKLPVQVSAHREKVNYSTPVRVRKQFTFSSPTMVVPETPFTPQTRRQTLRPSAQLTMGSLDARRQVSTDAECELMGTLKGERWIFTRLCRLCTHIPETSHLAEHVRSFCLGCFCLHPSVVLEARETPIEGGEKIGSIESPGSYEEKMQQFSSTQPEDEVLQFDDIEPVVNPPDSRRSSSTLLEEVHRSDEGRWMRENTSTAPEDDLGSFSVLKKRSRTFPTTPVGYAPSAGEATDTQETIPEGLPEESVMEGIQKDVGDSSKKTDDMEITTAPEQMQPLEEETRAHCTTMTTSAEGPFMQATRGHAGMSEDEKLLPHKPASAEERVLIASTVLEMTFKDGEGTTAEKLQRTTERETRVSFSPSVERAEADVEDAPQHSQKPSLRVHQRQGKFSVVKARSRPPSWDLLQQTAEELRLPSCVHPTPFYSDRMDKPSKPKIYGGVLFRIPHNGPEAMPEADQISSVRQGLQTDRYTAFTLSAAKRPPLAKDLEPLPSQSRGVTNAVRRTKIDSAGREVAYDETIAADKVGGGKEGTQSTVSQPTKTDPLRRRRKPYRLTGFRDPSSSDGSEEGQVTDSEADGYEESDVLLQATTVIDGIDVERPASPKYDESTFFQVASKRSRQTVVDSSHISGPGHRAQSEEGNREPVLPGVISEMAGASSQKQLVTTVALEVHGASRGVLRSDPKYDPVRIVVMVVRESHKVDEATEPAGTCDKILVIANSAEQSGRNFAIGVHSRVDMRNCSSEVDLYHQLGSILNRIDPDIIVGYARYPEGFASAHFPSFPFPFLAFSLCMIRR